MGLRPRGTAQGEQTAKALRAGERRPHLLLAPWYCRDLQWADLCTQVFFLIPQAAEVPLTPNTEGSVCSQGEAGASPAYRPGTSTPGAEELLDPLQGFYHGKNLSCAWK